MQAISVHLGAFNWVGQLALFRRSQPDDILDFIASGIDCALIAHSVICPEGGLQTRPVAMIHLERFERRVYTHRATDLVRLERFSQAIGDGQSSRCPSIYIKRDDCLGLLGGGNKTRKLEFVLAEALDRQADTIITCGAVQSNSCRATASAAKIEGLRCQLALEQRVPGSYDPAASGNNFLYRLLGVDRQRVVAGGTDMDGVMSQMAADAQRQGRRPYVVPLGAGTPLGALGYVKGANEIMMQSRQMDVQFDAIIHASGGSGGTQSGLLVGFSVQKDRPQIIGICSGSDRTTQQRRVHRLVQGIFDLLAMPSRIGPSDVVCYDDYVGPGYSRPTAQMAEAVELMAQTEGILLDPVYSGKAMAGLIDLVRQGRFETGQNILFVHTGGVPAIYHYNDDVLAWLSTQSAPYDESQ